MKAYDAMFEGKRISCRKGGKGDEVLFLHADFVDSRMWDGTMRALEGSLSVAAYDKLGFGASDKAEGPLCRRKELAAVMETLGEAPVHLVGCANGGQQAIDYALERPERVKSLCLVNSPPSGFVPRGEPPAELMEMIRAMQEGRLDEVNDLQLRIWFDGPRRGSAYEDANRAKARELAREMNRVFVMNGTFPIADMNPRDPLDPPAISRLSELRLPVLVVSGVLDYDENRRASRVLADGIPGARFIEMDDCAHVPPLEDPVAFSTILGDFLSSAG